MDNDQTSSERQASVGYGRPPVETRFRKGQSGNPAGRPKGSHKRGLSERLKTLMREEALREIDIEILGERTTLSVAQAAMRSLAVSAAWGRPRELAMFLDLLNAAEDDDGEAESA